MCFSANPFSNNLQKPVELCSSWSQPGWSFTVTVILLFLLVTFLLSRYSDTHKHFTFCMSMLIEKSSPHVILGVDDCSPKSLASAMFSANHIGGGQQPSVVCAKSIHIWPWITFRCKFLQSSFSRLHIPPAIFVIDSTPAF